MITVRYYITDFNSIKTNKLLSYLAIILIGSFKENKLQVVFKGIENVFHSSGHDIDHCQYLTVSASECDIRVKT